MNQRLQSAAETYFDNNLLGKVAWNRIPSMVKEKALVTAMNDVNAYIGLLSTPSILISESLPFTFYQIAVYDWALYLVEHKDEIESKMAAGMTSVVQKRVDGFGAESYERQRSATGDAYNDLMMGSRAGRYLRLIPTEHTIIR